MSAHTEPAGALASAVEAAPAWLGQDLAPDLLPGPGLPQDRHVRVAARRLFVELKQRFTQAVEPLDGGQADWLRDQVQQAAEPLDLWLLRGMVYAALLRVGHTAERTLRELQATMDSAFPDGGLMLPFGTWR